MFEAIGRVSTVELAIDCLPIGGTAVLVGLTRVRGTLGVVRRSIRWSTAAAGFSARTTASPTRPPTSPDTPSCHLAGRLPIDRLIDRRIGLGDLEGAFDRLRVGEGLRQVVVFD